MRILGTCILSIFPLAVSVTYGQGAGGVAVGPQVRTAAGQVSGSVSFPAQRFIPPAVAGAPYSAEQTQEHVQTLNDGTHITETQMHTKLYRDSQGRTRTERPLMMLLPNGQDSPLVVDITDPVAGVRYTLDTQSKVAHRVTAQPAGGIQTLSGTLDATIGPLSSTRTVSAVDLPPPPPASAQTAIIQRLPAPHMDSTEAKLAPQMIEGVLAEGVRRTTIIQEGAQGNDRPFAITSETWTSPDLQMVVLSKGNDPRSGETIMKLTNISRNEPDPGLFQPPPDYQIVDETGQFTIHYSQ